MASQLDSALFLVNKLATLPLLKNLESRVLNAMAEESEWFSLPGGQLLFSRGDTEDSLYVVLSGRLGAFLLNAEGKEVLIHEMRAGETVGETALWSGEPRSATVVALRDTEMVRLSKPAFTKLVAEYPESLRFITDLLVRCLREPPRMAAPKVAPRTVAIFPLDRKLAASGFTRSLTKALEDLGFKVCALDHDSTQRPTEWFNAVEDSHDLVLYETDFELSPWTRLCIRQADRLMLLVDAARPLESISPAIEAVWANPRRTAIELVIYGQPSGSASQAQALLNRFDVSFHHHVRAGVARDLRRLGRMLLGRAIGVVLSGGGARGLAHIGVIRALREAGLELDLFGGTSMGSIIAAAAALEWSDEDLIRHMREVFFESNPVSDYTLPLISLVRGRKTTRLLRSHFGDHNIEDCPCPFFCVSTNLSTGRLKIHRTGPIWLATRASIAIPGVLPPVIDGTDILIDGGILNNLPIDIMSEMGRGPIIAVDVTRNYGFRATIDDIDHRPLWQLMRHARKGTPNILTILMGAVTISSEQVLQELRGHVDLLIEPPLLEVGILHWKGFEHTMEAGYRYTMELLEKKKDALQSVLAPPQRAS